MKDPIDNGGLGDDADDDGDDVEGPNAARPEKRVDFVDAADHAGPGRLASLEEGFVGMRLAGRRVRGSEMAGEPSWQEG